MPQPRYGSLLAAHPWFRAPHAHFQRTLRLLIHEAGQFRRTIGCCTALDGDSRRPQLASPLVVFKPDGIKRAGRIHSEAMGFAPVAGMTDTSVQQTTLMAAED